MTNLMLFLKSIAGFFDDTAEDLGQMDIKARAKYAELKAKCGKYVRRALIAGLVIGFVLGMICH